MAEAGRHALDVELVGVEPAAATDACSPVVVEVQGQLVAVVAMAAALLPMAEVVAGPQIHLNWNKNDCLFYFITTSSMLSITKLFAKEK